jgi:hypothetical protein
MDVEAHAHAASHGRQPLLGTDEILLVCQLLEHRVSLDRRYHEAVGAGDLRVVSGRASPPGTVGMEDCVEAKCLWSLYPHESIAGNNLADPAVAAGECVHDREDGHGPWSFRERAQQPVDHLCGQERPRSVMNEDGLGAAG